MKLNQKGVTIIEVVFTFTLIMGMVLGMFAIVLNYRQKASISLERLKMETFKNTLTKDIQDDILTRGVKEMNDQGDCVSVSELNRCVNIVFQDGTEKALATSLVKENDRNSIENKFIYYDGIKYELQDLLPENIPEGRKLSDFQAILIQDTDFLSIDSTPLEDGTLIRLYAIDIYISHIDFSEDFGIHIVASTLGERETDSGKTYLIQRNLGSNFNATNVIGNSLKLSNITNESQITQRKVENRGDYLYFYQKQASATESTITYSSNYAIDLTPYQKMHVRYRVIHAITNSSGHANLFIGFHKNVTDGFNFAASVSKTDATTTKQDTGYIESEVDITSLSGRYYLSILSAVSSGEATLEVSDIWLTK